MRIVIRWHFSSITFQICSFTFVDIRIVSSILWYWPKKCTALWKISIRSKKESSSFGLGSNDIRGAKHNRTHGATNIDTYAEFDSVSTGSGIIENTMFHSFDIHHTKLMNKRFNRFCWFTRHRKEVFREFSILKQMMLAKKRIIHAPVHLNQDFPSISASPVMLPLLER